MSPLKLVGGRNLDDELDDFDGADHDYEEDENLSEGRHSERLFPNLWTVTDVA